MVASVMCGGLAIAGEPVVRVETGAARAGIMALSWDTEGTGRERINLLRPDTAAGLRFRVAFELCAELSAGLPGRKSLVASPTSQEAF